MSEDNETLSKPEEDSLVSIDFSSDKPTVVSLISRVPGVCGGTARIRGTRIPIWGLEDARRHGISDDTILKMYPTITREDLAAAWAYVESHPAGIDALIASSSSE